MAFGGADFVPSRTPAASNALQLAAVTAVNAASRKTKNLREFTAQIKEIFEQSNGHGWHILAGSDFAVDLRYRKAACVLLSSKRSKLKVLLYRTTPAQEAPTAAAPNSELPASSAAAPTTKKVKIQWFSSDMTDDSKKSLTTLTQQLLTKLAIDQNTSEFGSLAQSLKSEMALKYGNTWHTIVSSSREVCCLPYCEKGTFADFGMDKFRIIVYRHNGVDIDMTMDLTQFGYRAMLTFAAICFVLYGYFTMVTSELHTKCFALYNLQEPEDEDIVLPEGCLAADVTKAIAHHKWKSYTLIGLVVFTVVASSIRIYRRALRQKLKHG